MHRLRHVFYPHNPGASKKNRRTLKRLFYDYLSRYPEWQIVAKERVNLLIEGTYFSNRVCVVLYREHNVKATLFYRLTDGEWEE
jgi:hypothetical protein